MNWIPLLIIALVLLGFFALKVMSFVPQERARQLLSQGALVVDVRSPAEFTSGHVGGAINVPLGSPAGEVARLLPDKTQVLLLHCLSGGRSGIAKNQLKKLGYARVFNLGSYGRAEKIIRAARQNS